MKTIDDQSPPGAWKDEMAAAPWAFGQREDTSIRNALAKIRQSGLWPEAALLEQRITALETEIERAIK
jgi:hypothetical protein